jgi:hypothetical protein
MSGASNFPTSLDTFVDPDASSTCNGTNPTGAVVTHRAMHTLENDAIAALQAKIGIDGSSDASSHDYKIAAAQAAILALQGTSLLYGSGAPTSGTGVDGNFYLDETAHVLYGPKASGAWPAGTSIIGPTGADGAPGAAATIAVGTVTTLSPGSPATVTNSGTSSAAVFDFGIPEGAAGGGGGTVSLATLAAVGVLTPWR